MRRLTVAFVGVALSLVSGGTLAAEEQPPGPGSFSPAGSLAEARDFHTATHLRDGRVLVVGGGEGERPAGLIASAEAWDPATETFGPAGSLAEVRFYHTATLLPDGRVLVVGGKSGDDFLASAEVWDPTTGTFGPTGSLAGVRGFHAATLLPDGRVLVVGGVTVQDGVAVPLASAEVWDPATGTFSPVGPLAEARAFHTATLLPDGRVLVVGGLVIDGSLASAEVWDPATETFSPTGSLATARARHTVTLLPDGRVLVVAGSGVDDFDPLASAEAWDPATGTFSPAGSLAEAREWHTATLLPDGRVLVVGGRGVERDYLASAEVWDPASGTFSPTGSLAEVRGFHTATLLPDGRVLVVGGIGGPVLADRGFDDYLASSEVWEPDTLSTTE